MTEKVKAWCNHGLYEITDLGYNAERITTQCYGIMQFVANELLEYPESVELMDWWDNEMLPQFRELL